MDKKNQNVNENLDPNKQPTKITEVDYKKELEKIEDEFKKYKDDTSKKFNEYDNELSTWKFKYEEYARTMQKRFKEKTSELEDKSIKEINFEKERVTKELARLKSSSLAVIFEKICNNVLSIANAVLNLPQDASPELRNYAKGFQMIIDNLTKDMIEEGLQIISPKLNEPFDPEKHHAISTETRKDAPINGAIIAVVSPQYCLNGSTISYAKVRVAIKG